MATKSKSQPLQKTIVKKPKVLSPTQKQRKKAEYKSFRLQKRIKHPGPKLPSCWKLFSKSLQLIRANKRQILWFFVIYAFLSIVLVRGIGSPLDVEGLRDVYADIVDESSAGIIASFTGFGMLVEASTNASNEVAQVYQAFLLIIASLAVIWLYRQQQAGHSVTIKQAYYRGMYPLIPFILVVCVIGLQFIPALIGNFLFQSALNADLIVNNFELTIWLVLVVLTMLLSFYMLSSSAIALYIVTLPEMTPMQALREARVLVRLRRLAIIGRIVALVIVLSLLLFVIIVPVLYFFPLVAEWLFFALTIIGIPLVHGYMFSLYRELL